MKLAPYKSRLARSFVAAGGDSFGGSAAFSIVLALLGAGRVSGLEWDRPVRLKTNHFEPGQNFGKLVADDVLDLLNLSSDPVEALSILKQVSRANEKTFLQLRGELLLTLAAYEEHRFETAFIHFYRVLERVSISLPVIYAQGEIRFEKTLEFFKSLIGTEKAGELSVLNKFITTAQPFSSSAGSYITLDLSFATRMQIDAVQKQFEHILFKEIVPSVGFDPTTDTAEIEIEKFHRVIIVARNKMFHYTHQKANFDMAVCGGGSVMCRCLVGAGLTWFATFYTSLLNKIILARA